VSFAVELRRASAADAAGLERLAQLDSARVPGGDLLVAAAGGELLAALSLATGEAIADPFVGTAHIVQALRAHAAGERRRAQHWRAEPSCQARLAT
jgi:hypothetical protein